MIVICAFSAWMAGCTASSGESCEQDSDCAVGLWCHHSLGICTEVTCDPATDKCHSDDQNSTYTETEDTAVPDIVEEDISIVDIEEETDITFHECAASGGITWTVSSFLVSTEATTGQGLDIDANPDTCAPEDICADGVDNSFATLANLVNTFMVAGMEEGEILLAVHQPEAPCNGLTFLKRKNDTEISQASYVGGNPVSMIPNLSFDDDTLSAGPDGTFRMPLAVFGVLLEVDLQQVSITGDTDGDSLQLLIGGALPYEELKSAIFSIPEGSLPSTVDSHQAIMDIIDPALATDLDVDADGTNESISIALQLDASISDLVFPSQAP